MSAASAAAFNPADHTITIRGGKQYLPVAARLLWWRRVHPDWSGWSVRVQFLVRDMDQQFAIARAEIVNAEGRVIGTGTSAESARGFPDWIEKAETSAVGRALVNAGFGAQFAPEWGG